jgi:hypothetical protein
MSFFLCNIALLSGDFSQLSWHDPMPVWLQNEAAGK